MLLYVLLISQKQNKTKPVLLIISGLLGRVRFAKYSLQVTFQHLQSYSIHFHNGKYNFNPGTVWTSFSTLEIQSS